MRHTFQHILLVLLLAMPMWVWGVNYTTQSPNNSTWQSCSPMLKTQATTTTSYGQRRASDSHLGALGLNSSPYSSTLNANGSAYSPYRAALNALDDDLPPETDDRHDGDEPIITPVGDGLWWMLLLALAIGLLRLRRRTTSQDE